MPTPIHLVIPAAPDAPGRRHDCPIPGCKQNLPASKLMCRDHWRLVGAGTKRAVYAAYDHGAGVGTPELLHAQEAAVAAVERRLGEAVMTSITPPEVTTYVRYYHPGAFLSEETEHKVSDRDPLAAARNAPETAFAFTFFDRASAVAEVGGKKIALRSDSFGYSGRYFIDAERIRDHSGPGTMLRCRLGNQQRMQDGDAVISTRQAAP